jgi:hypothetical protein
MSCAVCKTAKPKRYCEGLKENICTACCGTGREETIDCALTCEYLAEAHRHEKKPAKDPAAAPGQDIPLDDDFLRAHEFLIVLLASAMLEGARRHPSATDSDAVAALDALARTWRTLGSGLYYETKPLGLPAIDMAEAVKARIEDVRARIENADSAQSLPDSAILGVLVFLQRVAFGLDNGRSKCKAFLVFLSQSYVDMKEEEIAEEDSVPRVIL